MRLCEAGRCGGATPVSSIRRVGARTQVQAAWGDSSPPHKASGDLLDSRWAARRQIVGGSRARVSGGGGVG
jgi:hypothetical protein